MQIHVFTMRDSSDRSYHDVVLAPDSDIGRRMFARRMLDGREETLIGEGQDSLLEYASESGMDEEWTGGPGKCCSSCSSHDVSPMDNFQMAALGVSPVQFKGRVHLCGSCAHTWLDLGYDQETRALLEARAAEEMRTLDEYERRSLGEDA